MKFYLLITVFIAISIPGSSQDFSMLTKGIEANSDTTGYHKYFSDYEKTRIYQNSSRCTEHEFVFNYAIEADDYEKDIIICLLATNGSNIYKIVKPETIKGSIVLKKVEFRPGNYRLAIFRDGVSRDYASLFYKEESKEKLNIGEYMVYWKGTKFQMKYIGIN